MTTTLISNPKIAADLGEAIYRNRYKDVYEHEHPGKFVAINVLTEQPFVSDTPEGALNTAHASVPSGVFHLIRVGHVGAFRVSHSQSTIPDWILR